MPRSQSLPQLIPDEVAKLAPACRATCHALVEALPHGGCDVADGDTRHVPVCVIAHMLGLPEENGGPFRGWSHEVLELGVTDPAVALSTAAETHSCFAEQIACKSALPGDDLITRLMQRSVYGEAMTPQRLAGILRLLLIAGIDATWSMIGSTRWHLVEHRMTRPGSVPNRR